MTEGKYLFIAECSNLSKIASLLENVIFGEMTCKNPLIVDEIGLEEKFLEGRFVLIGDFTLKNYYVEDVLDEPATLIFLPKFKKYFKSIKEF